jgi:hypothetical protein
MMRARTGSVTVMAAVPGWFRPARSRRPAKRQPTRLEAAVSRVWFLPRPVVPGRPAPDEAGLPALAATRRIPVLRLAGTITAGQASRLTRAVLARVTRPGVQVGTVVLDLGSGAGVDAQARECLCALRTALLRRGTNLRLVITSAQARDALAAGLAHRTGAGLLHPTLRAAVLASYAEAPGPGVVSAEIRAALAVPAEPVRTRAAALPWRPRLATFTQYGWGAPREVVAGLASPERTLGGKGNHG